MYDPAIFKETYEKKGIISINEYYHTVVNVGVSVPGRL